MSKRRTHDNDNNNHNKIRPIKGLTQNQIDLIDAIDSDTVKHIFITGPAGTGKSYISVGKAADFFVKSNKNKIVIARPMVPNGDDIGFLPGDEKEKSEPWAKRPLNIISERIGRSKMECDLRKGNIEVAVLQMMQGESYSDCWIIIDEAQEMTVSQARMIVTRTESNCKLIINGDIKQCNLKEDSGLSYLLGKLKANSNEAIKVIEFDIDDCQRDDLCKFWLESFDN